MSDTDQEKDENAYLERLARRARAAPESVLDALTSIARTLANVHEQLPEGNIAWAAREDLETAMRDLDAVILRAHSPAPAYVCAQCPHPVEQHLEGTYCQVETCTCASYVPRPTTQEA